MTTGRINQIAFVEKNNHESEDSGFEGWFESETVSRVSSSSPPPSPSSLPCVCVFCDKVFVSAVSRVRFASPLSRVG